MGSELIHFINPIDFVRDEIVQLFSYSQEIGSVSILAPEEHTLLSLVITTTELGQRVKLDSMAVIQYITNTTGSTFSLGGQYSLYRDNILIAFVDINKDASKPEMLCKGKIYTQVLHGWKYHQQQVLTLYQLRVRVESGNIEILDVLTGSLNAMVFRQAL